MSAAVSSRRIGWLDCGMGASGDMLLAAFLSAGADEKRVQAAVRALDAGVRFERSRVTRGQLTVDAVEVVTEVDSPPHRTWLDVGALLEAAPLEAAVRERALAVFAELARAEAQVHGSDPEQVEFHEVGALDALLDVVGVCAAHVALGLERLHAGVVSVGGGEVAAAHGVLPVPPPAVVEIARAAGIPTRGGPVDTELCTPTGAALLAVLVDVWGPLPAGTVAAVGTGAGGRDVPGRVNAVRLLVLAAAASPEATEPALVLETNVDDLDPRLWPGVLTALLDAGAADAWLTPILMKKGRPAHTLSVLTSPERADAVRAVVFRATSAIGLREHTVDKRPLERQVVRVEVVGHPVRVKLARLSGEVVNAQPEYDDLVAVAAATGLTVKQVLAAATAAAGALWPASG